MEQALIESLLSRFHQQDRNALAQIITIIESSAEKDFAAKRVLLAKLVKNNLDTIRVAISGPPGVGKSTFINTLGQAIVDKGYYLSVLPIDPSSEYNGGSILGDKTRMKELMAKDRVYIRPSASRSVLGGVSLNTFDVMNLVEAFGCNFLLIETVGVGQSEAMAHALCDHFVLLLQPGSGDSLQSMKKGVLESADFVLVNKSDAFMDMAKKTKSSLSGFKNAKGDLWVGLASALNGQGVEEFLRKLLERHAELKKSGELKSQRNAQFEKMFNYCFEQELIRQLKNLHDVKKEQDKNLSIMPQVHDLVTKILGKKAL